MVGVVWLRRSLREFDNTSIVEASKEFDKLVLFYCIDKDYFDEADLGYPRVRFWHDSLKELKKSLEEDGKKLIIRHGKPVEELGSILEETGGEKVFVNQDYSPYFRKLVKDVENSLGVDVECVKDSVMFEKEEITTNKGTPYKVYTYFMKKWFERSKRKPEKPEEYSTLENLDSDRIPSLSQLGFEKPDEMGWEWEAGRKTGLNLLEDFMEKIGSYHTGRDKPFVEATSKLSPHLKFGTVSIREAFWRAEEFRKKDGRVDEGVKTWQEELAWRDFYFQVLWNWPETVEKAFLEDFRGIEWEHNLDFFDRWRKGETGYPFIDAGMRQLRKTGWMHNRLRMAVTSFAAKDLFLDWREVHRFFSEKFVDAELSSMLGGIQWAYSIGTDAQPYFRIFNPVSQGEKHDPDGKFVKRFVPELKNVPKKYIHQPWRMPEKVQKESNCIIGSDYPEPIVEHSEQREKALELFKSCKD